jgi:uncharacterized protein (DUF362 family)
LSASAAAAAVWLSGHDREPRAAERITRDLSVKPDARLPELAVVRGGALADAVLRAVAELGGMHRFIARGDLVLVKPNMAWDRTPEQAANTSPAVVAAIVSLALAAGARRVIVTDAPINEASRVLERSGIAAAARRAGASVVLPEEARFREVDLGGRVLRDWPVLEPVLSADKIINVPAAKHHSLTGVTLGIKNLYGILGGDRRRLHQNIDESLADLAAFLRPTLTLVDARRVLLRNGPSGGNLADVACAGTILAATDPVAVDAYTAAAFWNLSGLRHLELAAARGLGSVDLAKVRTRIVAL